ncbi:MAG: transglutaminase-like domain-containing protein [Gallionellaceae bacterium]|jgi:transglutaminase-like putative cysteine protease
MRLTFIRLLFFISICLLTKYSIAGAGVNTSRPVTLTATISIKNSGDTLLNGYTQRLTIPANDHAQQRLLSINYKYPDDYTLRRHDNGVDNYMQFKWDIPPRSHWVREIAFQLRLTPFNHNRDPIPKSAKAGSAFLAPSEYVESNSTEIQAIAQQLRNTYSSPAQQLLAAFQYPQNSLRYKQMANKGALFALHSGIGDCTEYAAVFVALSRALGIPARMTSEFNFSESRSFTAPNHHAAEAYLDGAWIPVDPNLALQPSLGYGFGYGAATKVILKRGDSWTWSNNIPGTSKAYRDQHVTVDILWSISSSDLPN